MSESRYKIWWRRKSGPLNERGTGSDKKGMPQAIAAREARRLNEKYPELHHWIEPVETSAGEGT